MQGTTKSLSLIDSQTGDMKSTFQIFSDLKDDWDKMSNSEKQALAISYAGELILPVTDLIAGTRESRTLTVA